ncbi:MAG: AsmA family protein [Proteobacteria bacterium]|nr:AsmA family protein [Pseudomonadota bacterium]
MLAATLRAMLERITHPARPRRARRHHGLLYIGLAVLLLLVALAVAAQVGGLTWPVTHLASALSGHTVRAEDVSARVFSATPSVTVKGLRVDEASSTRPLAEVGRLRVEVNPLGLISARPLLHDVEIDQPSLTLVRNADGSANWKNGGDTAVPVHLPAVRHLSLSDGHLTYSDAAHTMRLQAVFASREENGRGGGRFTLKGDGQLNGKPFSLDFDGPAMLGVRADVPYAFSLAMKGGNTELDAKGQVREPFDLTTIDADVRARGQNLADLYYLTGLVLPTTKPYELSLTVGQQGNHVRLDKVVGKVGGSDLSGDLTVVLGGERPVLKGALVSHVLDVADVGILFGPTPNSDKLFPTSKIDVERLHAMDAQVHYAADSLNLSVALREVSTTINLDNGLLRLDPLAVTLPQGRVEGTFTLDAREATPNLSVDAKLSGARLESFIPGVGGTTDKPLEGNVVARAQLAGRGESVHDAMAAAQGSLTLVVPHGEIRQAFAELMGIDVVNALGLLATGNTQTTQVRCGVASFSGENGVFHANTIVLDTGVVLAEGSGSINLGSEKMDLTFKGHPKQARVLRVVAPVKVSGLLRKPQVGVDVAQAGAQAGVAVALGALLTPIAGILPFVDPGLADDADCKELLAQARASGNLPRK